LLARPIGLRAVATMTASGMTLAPCFELLVLQNPSRFATFLRSQPWVQTKSRRALQRVARHSARVLMWAHAVIRRGA
jgi:hypothetical protein